MGLTRPNKILPFVVIVSVWCLVLYIEDGSAGTETIDGLIVPEEFYYPPEHIYDTRQYPDESLVNVQVESNRWPDCNTFETTVQSIFRIEGVSNGTDEDKALALWKWVRILMSATGNGYAFEGQGPGKERIVFDGHKILTVYGHHQCDGLSWAMVPLWRAAGYMAFDEASHGHTTASLRYQDHDGKWRFHSFDPQGRFIWWNPEHNIVGNRTLPLMQGSVHRHLTLPQKVHSLRTSLHQNEQIDRRWENTGHVIPYGQHQSEIAFNDYFRHRIGRKDGVYASAGMEIQRFSPDLSPIGYQKDLHSLSRNIKALSGDKSEGYLLYPADASRKAEAVYRIYSPYPGVNATVEMTYRLLSDHDRFRLYLSRDGDNWEPVFTANGKGEHHVKVDLGRKQRELGRPSIYTAYTFFLKVEMETSRRSLDVGLKELSVEVYRILNKRTLPNLLPGDNIFRVSADAIIPGKALELVIDYHVKGKEHFETHMIFSFPYYFNVQVSNAAHEIRDSYDTIFGQGDIRMKAIRMQLVNALKTEGDADAVLSKAAGEQAFEIAHPHPAGSLLIKKKTMTSSAVGKALADGFFPQKGGRTFQGQDRNAHVASLIKTLKTGKDWAPETWKAAEELGNFPEALNALLEELPGADIDLTLFICKALAQIRVPEAIGPLLKKWEQAPSGAPGTRYIPDVLAAIGDPEVVPHLVEKLKHVRFDFRFHIARALGILGGNQARNALQDLAVNDPFPAVRQMAEMALSDLHNNE